MNILLIGSGGREHALGSRMLQDSGVNQVFVYPGNPGMRSTSKLISIPDEQVSFERALGMVKEKKISLVVIGPETYLFQGWVDQFEAENIPAFGPNRAAAVLEESKIKSKQFMVQNKIPTAAFQIARTLDETLAIINSNPEWDGYVLKLSGPAQGKGVVVAHTTEEAILAAQDFFKHRPPGIEEGLVIEECIQGKEVSLFYICLEDRFQFLTSACDHKRLLDQDQGPNTGGMGAYSPANWVSADLLKKAEKEFVIPTLSAMKKNGTPFRGVLFLGLMVRNETPYLLEYNTRFGDPETQAILPRIEGNFSGLLKAVAEKDFQAFQKIKLEESRLHSLHVVKAARGYPGLFGEKIETGKKINIGPVSNHHQHLYFAGVREENGELFSSGGRVLGLTALSDSIAGVQNLADQMMNQVFFEGEQYRTDIGVKR
jgi:phosphoribosylamine--glycine ligase